MNYKVIDTNQWKRKEQFDFFRTYDEPFFGVCFDLDISKIYSQAKQNKHSVFLTYLYFIMKAVNSIEEFKYRILDDKPILFEKINVSSTIARPDHTFGFSYFKFHDDFQLFCEEASIEIDAVKHSKSLSSDFNKLDVIHFSSLPWIQFTSISHARSFKVSDCIPKITCGKIYQNENTFKLPIAIHVHHALMDGYHIGEFNKNINQFMNES